MKFKKLAVASAMAIAALSGQAMAAAPGIATTPDIDVYLTGASAPQNTLGALAQTLFGANTAGTFNNYNVFYDNGANIGASYRAYYGALQAPITVNSPTVGSVTLPAGTKVRIINRNKGGSVWGVDPVARAQNIAWMNPSSSNCTLQTNTSLAYQYLCAESGSDTNAADPNNRISDFGVSDVEPAMFKAPLNVEGSASELLPAEIAKLTSTATSGLLFGVPATTSVPNSINFTRGLYSSLLSGLTQDWTSVDPSLTGNTQVVICRRVQGSGTQTTYNAYFNNFPCAANSRVPGVLAPARMGDSAGFSETATTITVNPAAGFTVIENSASGDVRACLDKAQTGGIHTVSYLTDSGVTKTVTVNFGTGGYRAIGTLSLDSTPNANWSFRNLNGQAPTKTNLRNGNYDFFGEQSMQYNNTGHNNYYPIAGLNDTTNWVVTAVNSSSPTYVKNKRAFIEEFIRRAGDPAILNAITNVQLKNATAALPLAYVPDESTADGLNTMYVTHQGNACSPVVRYPYPGL
jgi:hypothetical protein